MPKWLFRLSLSNSKPARFNFFNAKILYYELLKVVRLWGDSSLRSE